MSTLPSISMAADFATVTLAAKATAGGDLGMDTHSEAPRLEFCPSCSEKGGNEQATQSPPQTQVRDGERGRNLLSHCLPPFLLAVCDSVSQDCVGVWKKCGAVSDCHVTLSSNLASSFHLLRTQRLRGPSVRGVVKTHSVATYTHVSLL